MKTLSKEDKQIDTPSSAQTDSVIDTTCEGIALDMKIVDEALAKARRARMIETKVKGCVVCVCVCVCACVCVCVCVRACMCV